MTLEDCTRHSPYSDPGRHAALLGALPDDLASVCAASRNVIAHYRAELPDLPASRHFEVDSRWLEAILEVDQRRHGAGLDQPRAVGDRVAGCCRDHALFVVGALRQRAVPARSQVGFAHCLTPGFAHDHVVEFWARGRWRRANPELSPAPGAPFAASFAVPSAPFDVLDLPTGAGAPFETAAQAWRGWRDGEVDQLARLLVLADGGDGATGRRRWTWWGGTAGMRGCTRGSGCSRGPRSGVLPGWWIWWVGPGRSREVVS